jgi:hypothetical protein
MRQYKSGGKDFKRDHTKEKLREKKTLKARFKERL